MAKEFWLNLPVKDVKKSIEFFTTLGFNFNTQHTNDSAAAMVMGDKGVTVMLFEEPTFRGFINNTEVADTTNYSEVLLSIDAQSKEEVDEMVEKVLAAGGSSTHKPYEMQGPMYGCVFSDIDGHRWNILYMDMSKMQ